jgi:glycosyl transferase family 25
LASLLSQRLAVFAFQHLHPMCIHSEILCNIMLDDGNISLYSATSDLLSYCFATRDMTHVYFINLDHRVDRRSSIEQQLQRLGIIRFERVPAVTIAEVPADILAQGLAAENFWRVSAGDIACGLSHQRAWSHFLATGEQEAIILEDDAAMTDTLLSFLGGDVLARTGADLIKLETSRDRIRLGRTSGKVGNTELLELASSHVRSCGYLISASTAAEALRHPAANLMGVDRLLFGHFGAFLWRKRILQAYPAPITQLDRLRDANPATGPVPAGSAKSDIKPQKAIGRHRRKRSVRAALAYELKVLLPRLLQMVRSPAVLAKPRPVPFAGDR